MKITVRQPTEIEIETIRLELAVRYDDEDMPYDFPLRNGNLWAADVLIDSGQIQGWPEGKEGSFHMKVCDCGTYRLFDSNDRQICVIENDYVPNRVVPGSYGDYVELNIDKTGKITNWPKNPDLSEFIARMEGVDQ